MSSNSPYLLLVDSSNFQQLGHIDVGDGYWGQFILVTRLSPYFYMEKVMSRFPKKRRCKHQFKQALNRLNLYLE